MLCIDVPALRDRLDDLPALCEVMLERISGRTGTPQRDLSADAFTALRAHDWPGNVRELRNVLEQATMLADYLSRITAEDLAAVLAHAAPGLTAGIASAQPLPLTEAVAAAERAAIREALTTARGNKVAAARLLGVSRATVYEKLANLGFSQSD